MPQLSNLATALSWGAHNIRAIVACCLLVVAGAFFRACYYSGRIKESVATNPPLPKQEAAKIQAASAENEQKAQVYQHIAVAATKRADSAVAVARYAVAQADTTHAKLNALPSLSTATLPDLQSFLNSYQRADTTGY